MNRAWFQSLFERIADDLPDLVECESVSDLGCVLLFPTADGAQPIRAHLGALDVGGRVLVSVARDGDPNPVLVSPVTSAVIAVCVR